MNDIKEAKAKSIKAGMKHAAAASARLVRLDGDTYQVDQAAAICGMTRTDFLKQYNKGKRTSSEIRRKPHPYRQYPAPGEAEAKRKKEAGTSSLFDFAKTNMGLR